MDLQSKIREHALASQGFLLFQAVPATRTWHVFTRYKGKTNSALSASLAFPELGAGAAEAPPVGLGLGPERADARGPGCEGRIRRRPGLRLAPDSELASVGGFHSNLHLHLASGHRCNSARSPAEPGASAGVRGGGAEAAAGEGPARRGGGAGAGAGWGAGGAARGGGAAPRGPRRWGAGSQPAATARAAWGARSVRLVKEKANRTPGHFGHSWGPLSKSTRCEDLLSDLDLVSPVSNHQVKNFTKGPFENCQLCTQPETVRAQIAEMFIELNLFKAFFFNMKFSCRLDERYEVLLRLKSEICFTRRQGGGKAVCFI